MGIDLRVVDPDPADPANRCYLFSLSWSNVRYWAEQLGVRGMVEFLVRPEFPDVRDFGLATYPDPEDPSDAARRFYDAEWEFKQGAPEVPAGIVSYKLSSNDRWLVTPRECRAALVANQRWATQHAGSAIEAFVLVKDRVHEVPFWRPWIEFLETAERREGFWVF